MTRKRFDDMGCSVACALNEVGDWWSLLVVKQAMLGTRRFVDFQHSLGIAKNILCNRLSRLVDNGVMVRVDVGEHGHVWWWWHAGTVLVESVLLVDRPRRREADAAHVVGEDLGVGLERRPAEGLGGHGLDLRAPRDR